MKRVLVLFFLLLPFFYSSAREANTTLNFPAELTSNYELTEHFGGMGFSRPVCLRTPDQMDDLYVVEKAGRIYLINDTQNPQKQLFMDIRSQVFSESECGLLSIAFHPDFETNKTFFVFYSTGVRDDLYQVVSKFEILTESTDLGTPYTFSETVLIRQFDRAPNHNGGDLHFGLDGYLYVSLGDEGGQRDRFNNSQIIDNNFFSSILRIDVDRKPENLEPNDHPAVIKVNEIANYKIPLDNPWVNATEFNGNTVDPNNVRTEFYAVGFRNPWRMSFDSEGNLWIGDVGQDLREDIDFIPNGQGGMNFGWNAKEGELDGPDPIEGVTFDDPLYTYGHGDTDYGQFEGESVTAGFLYEGSKVASLTNKYLFCDYISGHIWHLTKNGDQVDVGHIGTRTRISALGQDPISGDILFCGYSNGRIYKLVENTSNEDEIPQTLTSTGAFSNVATLEPEAGVEAYEPNVTFWSDYALKSRWFSLPQLDQTFGFQAEGSWDFPAGTVWVKHFDLEMVRGNPSTAVRVETRFLVKTEAGAYGLSYRWNDEGTEAHLVSSEGEDIQYEIEIDGSVQPKTWSIPSRTACMVCHTGTSGMALSFNTRQLNRNDDVFGAYQNILTGLYQEGYLDVDPGDPEDLHRHYPQDHPTATLDQKARSYLDVNCAYCHQDGGSTPAAFDVRALLSNDETGMINIPALNDGGDPTKRLIIPGDHNQSVVWNRISETDGFSRMPPIATTELDHDGIALIQSWIEELGLQDTDPVDFYTNYETADINTTSFNIEEQNGQFTMSVSAGDIWRRADEFGYTYMEWTGDATIMAKFESLDHVHAWSKVGVMMRASLSADSRHASLFVTNSRVSAHWRVEDGGLTTPNNVTQENTTPVLLKMERTGDVFTASYSYDEGQTWIENGQRTIVMPETIYLGLAFTSRLPEATSTAVISDVQVLAPVEEVTESLKVTVNLDPYSQNNWNFFQASVSNESSDASVESITFRALGGGHFDIFENGSQFVVLEDLGVNNDQINSTEVTLNFPGTGLAPGESDINGEGNRRSDLDGNITGYHVVVRFSNDVELSGSMINIGDTDDEDSDFWSIVLEIDQDGGEDPQPEEAHNVTVNLDPYSQNNWNFFQAGVINNSIEASVESVTFTVTGGGYFDIFENGFQFVVEEELGVNNDQINSTEVTLNFGGLGLLPGQSDINGEGNRRSDLDGIVTGYDVVVRFSDNVELSGSMINIGDLDDEDSDFWSIDLTSEDIGASLSKPQSLNDETVEVNSSGGGCLLSR